MPPRTCNDCTIAIPSLSSPSSSHASPHPSTYRHLDNTPPSLSYLTRLALSATTAPSRSLRSPPPPPPTPRPNPQSTGILGISLPLSLLSYMPRTFCKSIYRHIGNRATPPAPLSNVPRTFCSDRTISAIPRAVSLSYFSMSIYRHIGNTGTPLPLSPISYASHLLQRSHHRVPLALPPPPPPTPRPTPQSTGILGMPLPLSPI